MTQSTANRQVYAKSCDDCYSKATGTFLVTKLGNKRATRKQLCDHCATNYESYGLKVRKVGE